MMGTRTLNWTLSFLFCTCHQSPHRTFPQSINNQPVTPLHPPSNTTSDPQLATLGVSTHKHLTFINKQDRLCPPPPLTDSPDNSSSLYNNHARCGNSSEMTTTKGYAMLTFMIKQARRE